MQPCDNRTTKAHARQPQIARFGGHGPLCIAAGKPAPQPSVLPSLRLGVLRLVFFDNLKGLHGLDGSGQTLILGNARHRAVEHIFMICIEHEYVAHLHAQQLIARNGGAAKVHFHFHRSLEQALFKACNPRVVNFKAFGLKTGVQL